MSKNEINKGLYSFLLFGILIFPTYPRFNAAFFNILSFVFFNNFNNICFAAFKSTAFKSGSSFDINFGSSSFFDIKCNSLITCRIASGVGRVDKKSSNGSSAVIEKSIFLVYPNLDASLITIFASVLCNNNSSFFHNSK